jgi:hypothetical protein
MRRLLNGFLPVLVALVALGAGSLAIPATSSAATIIAATTTCSNGVDNTPGLGLICEVTIINTITPVDGAALVTVRECHGAAGDPEATCTIVTSTLTSPVSLVDQCNDSTTGGGGTLRCSVQITNEFVDVLPDTSTATINQCVGSGDGFTVGCDPFPATTSGAAITQCNGSANGGTLVGLICTATGTQASAFIVTVNQCNGSTNGGGALVICSAGINNVVRTASVSPTPTASPAPSVPAPTIAPGATATPGQPTSAASPIAGATGSPVIVPEGRIVRPTPTLPATATASEPMTPGSDGPALGIVGLFLVTLLMLAGVSRQSRRPAGSR